MSAPLMTPGALAARYHRQPAAVLDIAAGIAARLDPTGRAVPAEALRDAGHLLDRHPDPSSLPLWGMPCVVGANIDAMGLVTSAGLPRLDFLPDMDAPAVAALRAAGALIVDKAPVDALGFDHAATAAAAMIAAGLAAFGLASDRTGAASLHAAAQGIVAVKPAPGEPDGLFGVTRGHDSLAVLAADAEGAAAVHDVLSGAARPYPAFARLGALGLGAEGGSDIARRLALDLRSIDPRPFIDLAALMEDDVWLSLRLADVECAFVEMPDLFPPRLRRRLAVAVDRPARELAAAERRLAGLRRQVATVFERIDLLLLPAEPRLAGFLNVCDLAAVALADGRALAAPAGSGGRLMAAAILSGNPTSTGPIDIAASSPLAHP